MCENVSNTDTGRQVWLMNWCSTEKRMYKVHHKRTNTSQTFTLRAGKDHIWVLNTKVPVVYQENNFSNYYKLRSSSNHSDNTRKDCPPKSRCVIGMGRGYACQ